MCSLKPEPRRLTWLVAVLLLLAPAALAGCTFLEDLYSGSERDSRPEPVPLEKRLLFKYRSFDAGDDPSARDDWLPLDRAALLGAEALRHLDRLVDGDLRRGPAGDDLVVREAEYAPIDHRLSVRRPLLRERRDRYASYLDSFCS